MTSYEITIQFRSERVLDTYPNLSEIADKAVELLGLTDEEVDFQDIQIHIRRDGREDVPTGG